METIESRTSRGDKAVDSLEEILGIQTAVDPKGVDVSITLHTAAATTITVRVPYDRIAALDAAIHHAAILMHYRQSMAQDEGEQAMHSLRRTALRPASVHVTVDGQTGDRVFVQQFTDHMPIVTAMSAESVNAALDDLALAVRLAAN